MADDDSIEPTTMICEPAPVPAPELPDVIPASLEEDSATGLHVTGTPQVIDPSAYTLRIHGLIENELRLSYDELRCLPKAVNDARLVCPGAFVDRAEWGGVALDHLLGLAGVREVAREILLTGADGYQAIVPIDAALAHGNLIAYELEGEPLPALHGFPARAVFPDEFGSAWIKWLLEIEVR